MTHRWIDAEEYDTAASFLKALLPIDDQWGDNPREWLFRGQSSSVWGLLPSAFRKDAFGEGTGVAGSREEQRKREAKLLLDVYTLSDVQGLPIPGDLRASWRSLQAWKDGVGPLDVTSEARWLPANLWHLAAITQHYRAPTRLIDWSRRPLTAAYFAASAVERARRDPHRRGSVSSHFAVWAYHRRGKAKNTAGDDVDIAEVGLTEVHAPRALVPNLNLQSGLFTLYTPDDPDAADGIEHDKILQSWATTKEVPLKQVLRQLVLPVTEARPLLERLDHLFVHGSSIYAGYEGAVRSAKERMGLCVDY